jgi:hypothetical protein
MSDNYNVACRDTAILDLCFVKGDSFSFEVVFPFDISTYTVVAKINSQDFTKSVSGTKLNLTITKAISANLSDHMQWYLKLEKGTESITYIKGKYLQE